MGEGTTIAHISKKDQIVSLFREAGIHSIEELAFLTHSSTSYIAQVLRDAHMLSGYFDLYTSSERPMNVYSRFFAKKLGFKDVPTAQRSIHYIDLLYSQFARINDHAGQHHALLMALTMRNRAVWSNKFAEAKVFADWLNEKISVSVPETTSPATAQMEQYLSRHEHALTMPRRKH